MSQARQPSTAARAARPMARPQRDTRVEILKSAAAAFRRRGYHGATVEEIATALDMNKGNLYYYFRNKEEILYACHQYSLDILLALLDEVLASADPPEVKLRRLIVSFVQTILDELHGTALFMDLQPLAPAHLQKVIARRDRFDRGIRQVLQEGMDTGVFAAGDAKLLAFAILGAVNWIPRWFDPHGAAPSETIAGAFADYLIAGLRQGEGVRLQGCRPRAAGYGAPTTDTKGDGRSKGQGVRSGPKPEARSL
ncbi:MAG: TetR family transcriptional regulator [Acidobacteriota bacterium]|nr:TetR family transcriptional regulator [Acidobacteriota bacterium]